MVSFVGTQPTSTVGTFALAMGAAIVAGQLSYPMPVQTYRIDQVGRTFSSFVEPLGLANHGNEAFAKEVASIFSAFAERQEPLGAEFEAAIYSNLEELYEA
jgi:hypothetical protein